MLNFNVKVALSHDEAKSRQNNESDLRNFKKKGMEDLKFLTW